MPRSTRNESFTYDSLNRIASGQSSGTQWGEAYTTDAWGNMTAIGSYNSKPHESLSTSAGTNNQLVGFGYDAAGNMTSNGSVSYVYDAENRLISTNANGSYSYLYDGDGQRVEKCTPEGTTAGTCASGATGTLYWRGNFVSDALTETDLSGNAQNNYVFFNGQRVARVDSAGAVHYYFSDHLGSHGVVENATATVCEQDIDYYPYGGVQEDYCPNVAQNYKFTSKERDSESGLDNFGARYNASSMGRFMTPDPKMASSKHLMNPQKWNKYGYTINNPLAYFDPDGMEEMTIVYRAFIPQSDVAYIGPGDGRSFSTLPNASSRVSVTMHIETDPAKNHGNPLIGKPDVFINTTHNNLSGNDTPAVAVQAPTVIPSQDANGNVNLNVQMNVHSGDLPAATSIRSDVNIGVNEAGTKGSVQGKVSGSPAFETNFTPQGAPTTNLPIQGASSNAFSFTYNLTKTNTVDKTTQIQQAPQSQEDDPQQ